MADSHSESGSKYQCEICEIVMHCCSLECTNSASCDFLQFDGNDDDDDEDFFEDVKASSIPSQETQAGMTTDWNAN